MSTQSASAAQIDAHLNALADQIDHRPRARRPEKDAGLASRQGYRVLLVVTGPGPTGDKTAAAAAARAKLERGRGSSANRAA